MLYEKEEYMCKLSLSVHAEIGVDPKERLLPGTLSPLR